MSENAFADNESISTAIDDSVHAAISAQKILLSATDDEIDGLVSDIANSVYERIATFAEREAVETGIGNTQDKIHKLSLVTNIVAGNLLNATVYGRLTASDASRRTAGLSNPACVEYAEPVGVIFAVSPLTNPIPNSLFKILNAIKTRNAIIISYPKRATAIGQDLITLVQDILERHGFAKTAVQCTPVPTSRDIIKAFFCHPLINLNLATGGASLVAEAQRSGKPTYGVGPGNVAALICKTADLKQTAQYIIKSKSYDNGIICGSENNLVIEQEAAGEFYRQLQSSGAAVLIAAEKVAAIKAWFDTDTGTLRKDIIGKPAKHLAQLAKISRDYPIQVMVIPTNNDDMGLLGKEKLAPILAAYECDKQQAISTCQTFLEMGGVGHTAVIYSHDPDKIHRFAEKIQAGRLLVNTPATFGMMGVTTDIPLSFMVGSGTFGNNITTDNLDWRHFVNIKRLAYQTREMKISHNTPSPAIEKETL